GGYGGALPAHYHRADPAAAIVQRKMQDDVGRLDVLRLDLALDRAQLASRLDRGAGFRAVGTHAVFGERDVGRQAPVEPGRQAADLGELRCDLRVVSAEELLDHEVAAEEQLVELLDGDEGGALGPALIDQVAVIADQGFAARAVVEESLRRPRDPALSV